ncbi:MAG: ribbon-helix-helix protein, CopG family [Myxococcales bacterium]|nr:ribbon-helix-helix protein, CopG family [Myxococcales bacterium]
MAKTIQVVLEDDLLRAANREARRCKVNRSALIREALRDHLRRRRLQAMEEQHRQSYERHPLAPGEFDVWERVQAWPEE